MLRDAGRVWLRGAIPADAQAELCAATALPKGPGSRVRADHPLNAVVAASGLVTTLQTFWPDVHPVRVLMFDKTPKANWGLPWHQDRVIAVRGRHEVDGYTNWSRKDGVWHCEPPEKILSDMLFVRVHLDDCPTESGPMEIAPGSHRDGVIRHDGAEAHARRFPTEVTTAKAGDVLVMSMLMLHRSTPASVPRRRRTLRIDFAPPSILNPPLRWAAPIK